VGNFTNIKNHIEDLHVRSTELVSGEHHGQLNCNCGEWFQAMFIVMKQSVKYWQDMSTSRTQSNGRFRWTWKWILNSVWVGISQ
jgi:hypothetical protein